MVQASKMMWDRAVGDADCCDLIHPWTPGCVSGATTMFWSSFKGSCKFYAVLYVIQLLIRGKKMNKKFLLQQFDSYLKSAAFGCLVGTSFVPFNCFFKRFLFQRFYYHTTVLFPMTLSGVGIYFEPPHRRYLVVSTFFNLVLEYWVRMLEHQGIVKRTPLRETIIFMFGSAYLFYLMRQQKDKNKKMSLLWFFTPPKVNRQPIESTSDKCDKSSLYCPHTGSCSDYIIKGYIQMFGLGCAMTMLRTVVPKLGTPVKAIKSITAKHFTLGLFLGGYMGIYRLVVCILCRQFKRDSARHAIPAGFLAGTAFWFNPNLSVSLASITSILHILCSRLYEHKILPENLPLPELLYALCQGLLFHARVMHPEQCPRYILNLVHTVTSGKVTLVYETFLKMLAIADFNK
ncbi:transmembrane protein 135-like [Arctopsyche grandis]|uniref:transmembrane protein 135-like n=1 Tax=Arctopsyche grandis TaxID=121162 RepID=UPI00406D7BFA